MSAQCPVCSEADLDASSRDVAQVPLAAPSRCSKLRRFSIASSARAIRSLFRPHCHRGSDCGCNCLNRPTVLALRNDSEAIRLRVLPGRAKALRIKFPRTTALVAGFCERLTGHLAVRRKRHSEFGAARCRGSEGLAVEESCLDIARSHRLSREGSARSEENPYDSQWSCIATFHSITSSAMASSFDGISRPSALAVLRLITRSNLLDCTTGRSLGFSPLRTRPAHRHPPAGMNL